jgi:hypothetical protein
MGDCASGFVWLPPPSQRRSRRGGSRVGCLANLVFVSESRTCQRNPNKIYLTTTMPPGMRRKLAGACAKLRMRGGCDKGLRCASSGHLRQVDEERAMWQNFDPTASCFTEWMRCSLAAGPSAAVLRSGSSTSTETAEDSNHLVNRRNAHSCMFTTNNSCLCVGAGGTNFAQGLSRAGGREDTGKTDGEKTVLRLHRSRLHDSFVNHGDSISPRASCRID